MANCTNRRKEGLAYLTRNHFNNEIREIGNDRLRVAHIQKHRRNTTKHIIYIENDFNSACNVAVTRIQ